MKLSAQNLDQYTGAATRAQYDRSQVKVGIAHIGVGGFHRSHQAMYLDTLMGKGRALDWGICGVGLMPADLAVHQALAGQDYLYTLVTKDSLSRTDARVIGSIVGHLYAPDDPDAVLAVLSSPATRVVSLTVTEGGYNTDPVTGEFDLSDPAVSADLGHGSAPTTWFGYVVEALARRRQAGSAPFTVVSCDNIQSNGQVARSAVLAFANALDAGLARWVAEHVKFPSSMVDRITPVTTPQDIEQVSQDFGIEDAWPVVCEPFAQWVLEDDFVSGRPPLEEAGVQLTHDVAPYERMKLRLLNASHQAIAYSGHLSGYLYAHEAASDPTFIEFLLGYMHEEALPTLGDVPGIDLPAYIGSLITRFANPAIRDTIARLCAFSSDRIPKWVVPVIQANLASGGPVERAAVIVASWARYAEGVDEQGRPIDVQDAIREEVMARARRQGTDPLAFIRDERLFGDLSSDQRFTQSYQRALALFHNVGAHRTLEQVNAALRQT